MVDSHCHLYDEKIAQESTNIINNFETDNIDFVIVPSCDFESQQKALKLSQEHEKVFCALAVHPHDAKNYNEETENFIINNYKNNKVVAIGEFGFDYFYNLSPFKKQIEVAERHFYLCNQCDLPAIFHIRDGLPQETEHYDAYKDFFNIAKNVSLKRNGVLHCFGGDIDKARKALDLGFYISFTCNATYQSNQHLRDAIKYIPIDRLLIETDSPYMSPRHQRSIPNQPKNVKYVAELISELKQIDVEIVYNQTTFNTKNLFYKIKL